MLFDMPFEAGKSGNPNGRPRYRISDGRTLAQLAREHTEDAVGTLVDIMKDKEAPPAARVSASTQILNRGWGQAPQTINVTDQRQPLDLSEMSDDQLAAIETLRSLTALTDGTAGSC